MHRFAQISIDKLLVLFNEVQNVCLIKLLRYQAQIRQLLVFFQIFVNPGQSHAWFKQVDSLLQKKILAVLTTLQFGSSPVEFVYDRLIKGIERFRSQDLVKSRLNDFRNRIKM